MRLPPVPVPFSVYVCVKRPGHRQQQQKQHYLIPIQAYSRLHKQLEVQPAGTAPTAATADYDDVHDRYMSAKTETRHGQKRVAGNGILSSGNPVLQLNYRFIKRWFQGSRSARALRSSRDAITPSRVVRDFRAATATGIRPPVAGALGRKLRHLMRNSLITERGASSSSSLERKTSSSEFSGGGTVADGVPSVLHRRPSDDTETVAGEDSSVPSDDESGADKNNKNLPSSGLPDDTNSSVVVSDRFEPCSGKGPTSTLTPPKGSPQIPRLELHAVGSIHCSDNNCTTTFPPPHPHKRNCQNGDNHLSQQRDKTPSKNEQHDCFDDQSVDATCDDNDEEFSLLQSEPSQERPVDLARWLSVTPCEGIIIPNSTVATLDVTVCIQQYLRSQSVGEEPLEAILVVASDDGLCQSCAVVTVTKLLDSLEGGTIEQLEHLGAPAVHLHHDKTSVAAPLERGTVERIVGGTNVESSSNIIDYPPLPKEWWWLLEYIYTRVFPREDISGSAAGSPGSKNGAKSVQVVGSYSEPHKFSLLEVLLTASVPWQELPDPLKREATLAIDHLTAGIELPATKVSGVGAFIALTKLARSCPKPLVSRSCVTNVEAESTHILCRAVLLSIPVAVRNVFLATIALLRSLLAHEVETISGAREFLTELAIPEDYDLKIMARHVLLQAALSEWLAGVFFLDSPLDLSVAFVAHFFREAALQPSKYLTAGSSRPNRSRRSSTPLLGGAGPPV